MEYKIAKFWSRVIALLIDTFVLGIIGFIFGLIFENFLVSIGNLGLLFGLLVSIIYFTIFDSRLLNGQTVGKRAFKIQVIKKDGGFLSIKKSLIRAIILCSPYFLINLKLPNIDSDSIINTSISIVALTLFIGIILIYILNNSTRQTLHDFFVESYVTEKEKNEIPIEFNPIKRTPFYIYGVFITLMVGILLYNIFSESSIDDETESVYKKIENIDGVISAGISRNTTTFWGENKSKTESFVITLRVNELPNSYSELDDSRFVQDAIELVFANVNDIDNFDLITVLLVRGFDIGIAKKHQSYKTSKTPDEWKTSTIS